MNIVLQAFPKWMKSNDGSLSEDTVFQSWSEEDKSTAWFDFLTIVLNIVKVLLQTGMFVSAAVGGFLDNTIPGELCVTSYYPRSSTDTRDGYNLTLPFVVFRVVQFRL